MRVIHLFIPIFFLLLFTSACTQQEQGFNKEVSLNSLVDSSSYAIGYRTGTSLTSQGFEDLDLEAYVAGFQTSLDDEESKISQEEIRSLFRRLNEYVNDKMYLKNQKEEEDFFAANRMEDGVIETPSGLQYKVVTESEGGKPFAQNKIVVMYEGRLIDGTIFDTTFDSGEPAEFVLGEMIPGWIEGIQLMSVGSEYEFFIPSELAYGKNPRPGGIIEPGDALIFKVQLVDILP